MAQNAIRADDFIDALGINTHLDYTDGRYSNVTAVLGALQYLGIKQVREHAPNPASDPYGQTHLGDAANAGLQFVFIASGGSDPVVVVQRIKAFVEAHPGSLIGIEGPNEVNNWPVTYNGLTGQAAAVAYQQAFFNAINAEPLLRDVPILGFTGYTVASAADWNNIHTYAKNGDQPFSWLSTERDQQVAADPTKPFALTEVGYHTSLTADTAGGWEGVDPNTQAKLTLNTIMDAAFLGSKQTFLYELLDAYSDPQGSNQERHFGLFNYDYSPKPAATAIRNLTTILADAGGAAETFAAGSLNYTVSGLPATARTYLTQKSDGSYQIVAWNEPDIWNQNTDRAITAAAASVTFNLDATFGSVQIYDPLLGTNSIRSLSNVSSLTVDVLDHPIIIQLSAQGAVTPTPITLVGTSKADTLVGGDAGDTLSGVGGNDTLSGLKGNDLLNGDNGLDTLFGGDGNDQLFGGAGVDKLFGDAGNDVLWGNAGNDELTGGAGADYFMFAAAPGADRIFDFRYADGDRIDLDGLTYKLSTSADGWALLKLQGGGSIALTDITANQVNPDFFL